MKFLTIILLALSNWLRLATGLPAANTNTQSLSSSLLSNSKCSSSVLESYDLDIAKLMTVGHRMWPETFQESRSFCVETRRLSDKINSFKARCATGVAKEFTAVIIYSIQRTMKTYCPKQANKKVVNFFKSHTCTNRIFNQTAKCLNRYIDHLQGIIKAPVPKQIPHACCQYFEVLKCFDDAFQLLPNCSEASETFNNFVRQIFDDIINLTCQDYTESSDKCDHLGAPPVKDPKIKRTKSFLLPLIDIWSRVDGN